MNSIRLTSHRSGALQAILEPNDVSSAKEILETIKALRNVFRSMENVVEAGLAYAEAIVVPVIHGAGLASLPNEILGKILKAASSSSGSTMPLQLTCRSIRECAIRMPELWTEIPARMNPIYHLKRSGARKLNILLDGSYYEYLLDSEEMLGVERAKAILTLLSPHSSRWGNFILRISRKGEVNVLQLLASTSFLKVFPSLRHVEICHGHIEREADTTGVEQLQNQLDVKDFIGQWEMPALEILSLTNCIPSRIQACPTTANFQFRYFQEGYEWDFSPLSLLLNHSLDSLKELTISMVDMFQEAEHEGLPAALMRLEKLTLTMFNSSSNVLRVVLASFEAPNVQEIVLHFSADYAIDVRNLVDAVFPTDKVRWPRAENIDILLDHEYHTDMPAIHVVAARLPKLKNLTIRSNRESYDYWDPELGSRPIGYPSAKITVHPLLCDEPSIPPLRTLSLIECPHDATFFIDNSDIFSSSAFEQLHIDNCWNIDKNVLRGLLPKDKVLIYKDSKEVCTTNFAIGTAATVIQLKLKLPPIFKQCDAWNEAGFHLAQE